MKSGLAKKVACVSMTDALLEIRAKIERAHSMLEFYRKRWKEKDDDLQLLSRDPTGSLDLQLKAFCTMETI